MLAAAGAHAGKGADDEALKKLPRAERVAILNAQSWVFDMLQNGEESSSRNMNWDTVWYSRGNQTQTGWEAEIVVPFKSLRFDAPEDGREILFGIGFKRNLPRKNEETYWPFVGNDSTWYRPAEMGTPWSEEHPSRTRAEREAQLSLRVLNWVALQQVHHVLVAAGSVFVHYSAVTMALIPESPTALGSAPSSSSIAALSAFPEFTTSRSLSFKFDAASGGTRRACREGRGFLSRPMKAPFRTERSHRQVPPQVG